MFDQQIQSRNQPVFLPLLKEKKVQLFLKREDEIHPIVSGNKFRKLHYNIAAAIAQGKDTLLTFGGAFSNHIAATAFAGKQQGLKTIGIIRGDELGENLAETLRNNATLHAAHAQGMQLFFVSRTQYREKNSPSFLQYIHATFGEVYLVPEGGTNSLAVLGCEEILTAKDQDFNYICCAVGTGGTIAGLINSAKEQQEVLGFPALKGDFLSKEITPYLKGNVCWSLQNDYHFGGYAKYNSALIDFLNDIKTATGISLEPIYTGKMMFGILDLVAQDYFPKGSKILAIHTGGLQGIAGINKQLIKKQQTPIQVS